jgi:hypothetical protein
MHTRIRQSHTQDTERTPYRGAGSVPKRASGSQKLDVPRATDKKQTNTDLSRACRRNETQRAQIEKHGKQVLHCAKSNEEQEQKKAAHQVSCAATK